MFKWSDWNTLVPCLLGLAGFVAFVFYEYRYAVEPVVRLSIFNNRTSAVSYFGTFLHGIILWCILYYLPLYYEGVKELSAINTGLALFPETFTIAPASVIVGNLITVTG